ncbi:MAG: hypothetical protein KU38_04975 [Sulfurovum sp. FS08-3]|nr:MAG: hypothetical protein KU38_04975 [Sulfurovum sp. FS08-3]
MPNQTHRVLEIIKRFNSGQKVCIEALQNEAMWEGKSDKTVRRDLDIIKAMFPDSFHLIRGEIGCYKAITHSLFSNIATASHLALLVQSFNIAQRSNFLKDLNIDSSDKKILQKRINQSRNIYSFKHKPFENALPNAEILNQLEHAIHYKKELVIEYQTPNALLESITIKPYKIVFMSENFYLACEVVNQSYHFSLFRLLQIQSVAPTKRTFKHNLEIDDFIKNMQTPLAKYRPHYKEHLIEVVVEISSPKAHYFKNKKFFASQKIVQSCENGELVVSFKLTDTVEIESFIMSWIPFVRVIAPVSLKEQIETTLKEY